MPRLNSCIFGTILAGILAIYGTASAAELRIYNWTDYIAPSLLKAFEAETGIRIVYDVYDSNELLETRLLTGKSGYDIVVPSASFMSRQIAAGVFRKLDKTKLPNLAHQWPVIAKAVSSYDPENAYSVTYLWGTTGFGYNAAKIRERLPHAPLTSWSLVYHPDVLKNFRDCGVHFLDSPEDLLPGVLRYLGRDPNSKKVEDYDAANAHIAKLKPYVSKFHSSEYINALANGDICLAVGYSGDIKQAAKRAKEAGKGIEIVYVIPQEGAQMWFDQMAIPADAPNPDAAHAFINFIQQPGNIAQASNFVAYANGNLASQPSVDKAILNDPSIYPPAEVMGKLFTVTTPDARLQRAITRGWTKAKTGQ